MRSQIIIYSGYWNIGLASTLLCPDFYHWLGLNINQAVCGCVAIAPLLYPRLIIKLMLTENLVLIQQ